MDARSRADIRFLFQYALAVISMVVSAESEPEYQVQEPGEFLRLVSLRLYGSDARWKEIAALNNIREPYIIRVGQRLRLPSHATQSALEGEKSVVQYWRKRLGLSGPPTAIARFNGAARRRARPVYTVEAGLTERRDPASPTPPPAFQAPKTESTTLKSRKLFRAGQVESALQEFNRKAPETRALLNTTDDGLWLEKAEADLLFRNMSAVPIQAARIDFNKRFVANVSIHDCERKVGKNLICARMPIFNESGSAYLKDRKGKVQLETRCLGFKE